MKNIIPFKKDIVFKTNLSEITSISLEHSLSIKDEKITGEFIINGDYKISENSNTVEPIDIKIPFEISIDERFDTTNAVLDIDDFYYEIVNSSILSLSIDVLVDKLKEKETKYDDDFGFVEVKNNIEVLDDDFTDEPRQIEKEDEAEIIVKDEMDSLFDKMSFNDEGFSTYSICIIRQGDNIESIIEKYGISEELLKEYNDLKDLKIGDKLIIPNINEEN